MYFTKNSNPEILQIIIIILLINKKKANPKLDSLFKSILGSYF